MSPVASNRITARQGTPEWLTARRSLITATDIGVILGLSPYKCEADLADEKLHGIEQETSLAMRAGLAMEPLIQAVYQEQTGRTLRRQHGLTIHRAIAWAGASLDYRVVNESRAVEAKWSSYRARWADGLPPDIEAQATWQAAVAGVAAVDVAVLLQDELRIFTVENNPGVFADLVVAAADFRVRLAAGGPFSRDAKRIKRDHPADDGSEIEADPDVAEAVTALIATRQSIKRLEAAEDALDLAIKARMGDAAVLRGDGWTVTWKRTKGRAITDWRALAESELATHSAEERDALMDLHTRLDAGVRPFRVTVDREAE